MALVSAFGTAAVVLSGTTETIVASTPAFTFVPVGSPTTYAGMVIRGDLNLTPGLNSTSFTTRVRQGTTITGALVGGVTGFVTAGTVNPATAIEFPFEVVDTSATPATQYTVSVLQSGSNNGTATTYEIEIDPVIP